MSKRRSIMNTTSLQCKSKLFAANATFCQIHWLKNTLNPPNEIFGSRQLENKYNVKMWGFITWITSIHTLQQHTVSGKRG